MFRIYRADMSVLKKVINRAQNHDYTPNGSTAALNLLWVRLGQVFLREMYMHIQDEILAIQFWCNAEQNFQKKIGANHLKITFVQSTLSTRLRKTKKL